MTQPTATERALVVSSDGHATAQMRDYRPYVDPGMREEYEAFLVARQPVAPPGGPHEVAGALGFRIEPGQHVTRRRRLREPVRGEPPGFLERLAQ